MEKRKNAFITATGLPTCAVLASTKLVVWLIEQRRVHDRVSIEFLAHYRQLLWSCSVWCVPLSSYFSENCQFTVYRIRDSSCNRSPLVWYLSPIICYWFLLWLKTRRMLHSATAKHCANRLIRLSVILLELTLFLDRFLRDPNIFVLGCVRSLVPEPQCSHLYSSQQPCWAAYFLSVSHFAVVCL